MRRYLVNELLDKIKSFKSYKDIPKGYWIIGIRSKSDNPDEFDDMFYLMYNDTIITITTGTTNPGLYSLKNYNTYGVKGSAVIKSDEIYYDVWSYGLHKNRMPALRQVKPMLYYRDYDKDSKSEEIGELNKGIIGINFHTSSYDKASIITKNIGKWSYGCQVCNNIKEYYHILDTIKKQKYITYCLINEF